MNFNELLKNERNFMEVSSSNKQNFKKTKLPKISHKSTAYAFAAASQKQKKNNFTIFDKFNSASKNDDCKAITNYTKTGMLRSGFNSQYETDKLFQINSKYKENLELNILEETQNQDLSSPEGEMDDCGKSQMDSAGKGINLVGNEIENRNDFSNLNEISVAEKNNFYKKNIKDDDKSKNYNSNNNNYNKENGNKINIIEKEKLQVNVLAGSNKQNLPSNKSKSRMSSTFKEKSAKLKKQASMLSARSKNQNSDLNDKSLNNNKNNNNNDISGLTINEQNFNSGILPTIENNVVVLTSPDLFENKNKTFDELPNKHNKNYINKTNNSLDSSTNLLNKKEISVDFNSNKKVNNKINNSSFQTDKSFLAEKENFPIKQRKNEKKVFPNEPTFYGQMLIGVSNYNSVKSNENNNSKDFKEDKNTKKTDYVNAAKTTLNYLSSALKTGNHQVSNKKTLSGLSPFTNNSSSYENNNNNNHFSNYNNNNPNAKSNYFSNNKPTTKNNIFNSFNHNNNYNSNYINSENFKVTSLQENLKKNNNNSSINRSSKIKLEKIKNHIRKNSQKEILVKEILDDSINEKVEIFKSILNSRDFIPQSEYDIVGTTPKYLRPINYSNFKNKNKKGLLNDYNNNFNKILNSENKNFNASEYFVIKNGYSFSPRNAKGLFRYKENNQN